MQKDIPAVIKAARIRCGYTQQELGEKIGYEGSKDGQSRVIRAIENGTRGVPLDKIRPLAAALGLTLDDLIP